MGRLIDFFGIIALMVFSCAKDAANTSSGRELLGVWVDVDHLVDRLLIYKEANGLVVIDNYMDFRTSQSQIDAIPKFSSR